MLGAIPTPTPTPEPAMRHVYSALLYTLLPLVVLRVWLRSLRQPGYRHRLPQRWGLLRPDSVPSGPCLWVHAVSVGEVQAAALLVEGLLLQYPEYPVLVTTTTPTGAARARELFGARVTHAWLPWDLPGAVCRFLDRARPRLLLLMERELWPNLLYHSRRRGCRILLANARLSGAAAARYRRLGGFTRETLACLDRVACQTATESERFLALGLSPDNIEVTGSVKFDIGVDAVVRAHADNLRHALGAWGRPVVVAASTHSGEEAAVLDAFEAVRRTAPDCLLVLAPRHPERCRRVRDHCRARGWSVVLRSTGVPAGADDDILLLDTLGELFCCYGLATAAFVGGSLDGGGGHNCVEPAAWGVAVVTGPDTANFEAINNLLEESGALLRVADGAALGRCLSRLLAEPDMRARMGAAGRAVVARQRGAADRVMTIVRELLAPG